MEGNKCQWKFWANFSILSLHSKQAMRSTASGPDKDIKSAKFNKLMGTRVLFIIHVFMQPSRGGLEVERWSALLEYL